MLMQPMILPMLFSKAHSKAHSHPQSSFSASLPEMGVRVPGDKAKVPEGGDVNPNASCPFPQLNLHFLSSSDSHISFLGHTYNLCMFFIFCF